MKLIGPRNSSFNFAEVTGLLAGHFFLSLFLSVRLSP